MRAMIHTTLFLPLLFRLGIGVLSWSRPVPESQPTRVDSLLSVLNDPNTETVLVVAHRGGWRNTVENSFESLQNAIDMGVDVVELDVRRTADSVLILMHDVTIDRTTNGKGKVSELSFDSIRNCFLKANDSTITTLRIPTLKEIFVRSRGKIMLNIDKGYKMFDEIMALAAKTGVTRQIIMKGNEDADHVQATAGPYIDSIIYMPIVNLDEAGAEAAIADFDTKLHPAAYELLFKSDTSRIPAQVRDFLSGRSRERKLEIMRDSRIGSMGVAAIFALLGMKFALFASIPAAALPVAAGIMMLSGRCGIVLYNAMSRYARPDGLGAIWFRRRPVAGIVLALLLPGALAWWFFGMAPGVALGAALLLFAFLWSRITKSVIGGATGDTIGCCEELCELITLVWAVAL